MRQHHRQSRRTALLGVVLLTIVLAACGGDPAGRGVATLDGNKAASKKPAAKEASQDEVEDALRKFARCMRAHGVVMPDPQFSGGSRGGFVKINGRSGGTQASPAKMDAAQKACQHLVDGVVANGPGQLDPQQEEKAREQALAFAKCMRDHGVDMPDPQFDSGGRFTQRLGGSPDDPKFKRAQQACAKGQAGPGFSIGTPGGGSQ